MLKLTSFFLKQSYQWTLLIYSFCTLLGLCFPFIRVICSAYAFAAT